MLQQRATTLECPIFDTNPIPMHEQVRAHRRLKAVDHSLPRFLGIHVARVQVVKLNRAESEGTAEALLDCFLELIRHMKVQITLLRILLPKVVP